MFPDFKPPVDKAAFRKLHSDMLRDRTKVLEMTPLSGPVRLLVIGECTLNLEPDREPTTSPTSQTPYNLPRTRPRAVEGPLPKAGFEISLTRNIQSGVDRSQVYAARLTLTNTTVPSSDVIVKLFQQSLLTLPREDNFFGSHYEQNEWSSATEIAKKEASAYRKLLPLQGNIIPDSYGFFQASQGLC